MLGSTRSQGNVGQNYSGLNALNFQVKPTDRIFNLKKMKIACTL